MTDIHNLNSKGIEHRYKYEGDDSRVKTHDSSRRYIADIIVALHVRLARVEELLEDMQREYRSDKMLGRGE